MSQRRRLIQVHAIEALMSAASNLLTIGIFFFMQHEFGWSLGQNFMLSAGLGVVYVIGALVAHPLTERFGRRPVLTTIYLLIAVVTLPGALFIDARVATIVILIFGFLGAMTWPIVESLVSDGDQHPHALSRRLAIYNVVWAATGAAVIAVNGIIIEKLPAGVFAIPSLAAFLSAVICILGRIESPRRTQASTPHPEPQLARQRVTALWLSRISVPAMYLMVYALAAMLPSLAVIQSHRPAVQTLLCSVWLVARCLAFVFLGATIFWHTRPRLLLVAAFMLLISLLLITLPNHLPTMLVGQLLFGAATGLIYSASLYFGMVLSEGSTEHGGYHEALIGLGMALGPAFGALSQRMFPGDQRASVAAIGGLVGISVLLAGITSIHLRRRRD